LQEDTCLLTPALFEEFKIVKSNIEIIEKDIPSTFPELNPIFESVHSLSESLREILVAFS
jgi:hypothetical protein